ncbi:MAG: hypothetical protein ACR2QB_01095 [Gammaproteobacteria bacterium]
MPQLLTVLSCSLFLLTYAGIRRPRPNAYTAGRLSRLRTGQTTRQQALSLLGKATSQTLGRDGSVAVLWSKTPGFGRQRQLNAQEVQVVFDQQDIVRSVSTGFDDTAH